MSKETNEKAGGRRELATKTPKYIQRCELSDDGESLIYDYMGSTEFEVGDQAKSLKRIFKSGISEYYVTVPVENSEYCVFYLVAGKDFDVSNYSGVIKGIVDHSFYVKESTYLDQALKKAFGSDEEKEDLEFIRTNSWFDFTNDVIFTHDPDVAYKMRGALEKIKTKWETPEPEHVTKFKEETKKVEEELRQKGYFSWFYLGSFAEIEGEYHAWLNDGSEHSGWYTLDELRSWNGEGEIRRTDKDEK